MLNGFKHCFTCSAPFVYNKHRNDRYHCPECARKRDNARKKVKREAQRDRWETFAHAWTPGHKLRCRCPACASWRELNRKLGRAIAAGET